MLREFRPTDSDAFFRMMLSQFPEEEILLGSRPEGLKEIVDRVYRWDYRFVLGLLKLLRRPVFWFPVVEDGGKLAAVALLSYSSGGGYISNVVVDPTMRRRGHGARVVEACCENVRKLGRRYAVLDVLVANAPARALYEKLGFRALRGKSYMLARLPDPARPAPSLPAGGRAFRKSDGVSLQRTADRELPDLVRTVLPVERSAFTVSPVVAGGLGATTAAWVVDVGRGAEAFVRATVSSAMTSGNLTCPVLGPGVSDAAGRQLVEHALGWIAEHGAPRVVSEVPEYAPRARTALEAAGFEGSHPLYTLYKDVGR